jgi:hypothetical protein
MRHLVPAVGLALTFALSPSWADSKSPPPLVVFSGAIGVDPLTAAGGVDALNVVRGVSPGGRAWVLRRLSAKVGADGSVRINGRGLLFTSGDVIGTRGGVANVIATLHCGPSATATTFVSPPAPLDLAGNFSIKGSLTDVLGNPAVMPATCDNPALLIRNFSVTTGAGAWFAAGIPGSDDDD